MASKTESGLFYIILGSVTSIFSTLVTATTPTNNSASCLMGIVSFLSAILILIGLIMIFIGRKEFGEEHRQFVIYALIAFVIGIIIIVMGAVLIVAGALSEVTPASESQEQTIDYSQLAQGMTTGLIVMQFGGLVLLLGEILLVFKLENELGRTILYLAMAVGIIMAIITTILINTKLSEFMDTLEDTPEEDHDVEAAKFQNEMNSYSALSLVGTILLLIAYYIPYERIKNGELTPMVLPSPYYQAPAYPHQYPYQPYPPQYPYQPSQLPLDPNIVEVEPPPPTQEEVQSIETMKCTHCGSQYPKESKICPVCGK